MWLTEWQHVVVRLYQKKGGNTIRRRLKQTLITALLLFIFCICPIQGQTIQDLMDKVIDVGIRKAKEQNRIYNKIHIRYTTTSLNIRKEPNTDSKVIGCLRYNQKVKVKKYDKNWVRYKNGYICKKYLSKGSRKSIAYSIPEYSGYKSFMDYRKITDESSPQWKLQQDAYTGDYGIRMIDNRFCIAVGFAFNPKIGQYIDLKLENGVIIPCIISDEKAIYDTDENNIFTSDNGCCTEFVIDIDELNSKVNISGDISSCCKKWDSPVKYIKIYNKNVND